ncbi:hypothetical protein [Sagittula sp. MA-2]|uniref:hypothetical protein n=1 Tax=Sagittula sp. MA-2 TaxID=3048007 RepID=UPI0024C260A5|nr:hypothetical protein [Sagittula sp. MA-2]WHZ33447.1 hypothetical protein QNI11_12370 [Sagittula sp. MA-2]
MPTSIPPLCLDDLQAPFIRAARTETMLRDFNRLRRAIRMDHDIIAAEKALDNCERWIGCIDPNVTETSE